MHLLALGALADSRCCFELHLKSRVNPARLLPSTHCTDEYPKGNKPATLQLLGTNLFLLQTGYKRLSVPLNAISLSLSVLAESTKTAGSGQAAPVGSLMASVTKTLAEKRDQTKA